MQINELRPFSKKVDLTVKVLSKNEVREVSSKLDNSTHKVTEALVGDASGTILLTLWDESIDKLEIGKSYKIGNGYTSLFKNSLRLNIGRYGTLADAEAEVTEVNQENNLSEKEFQQQRRFGGGGRFGGGRRFGGGGFGGNRRFGNRNRESNNNDNEGSDDSDAQGSDDEDM
jgi:replication factor A1